jgi:hypothetical protein
MSAKKPRDIALLLEALAHALAAPGAAPLFSTRSIPGLFPNSAAGKSAAAAALQAGWLSKIRTQTKGRTAIDFVAITPAGQQHLLEQSDPRPILEAIHAGLIDRAGQLDQLQSALRLCRHDLDTLQARVEALAQTAASSITSTKVTLSDWPERLAVYLRNRQRLRPAEDCPLPELFHQARAIAPELSVGEFHDGLRRLQLQRQIALQPWTGPLHELPEPRLALMQGHTLAYYASAETGL